jgi:hypothetical protein
MKSPELIAKMLAEGNIGGAAAVFAAELHHQFAECGDIDEAMAAMTNCLPADPDLRQRMLALVPHVTRGDS